MHNPRVQGWTDLSGISVQSSYLVDGFGSVGAPWPPGLPNVSYWSGTENIDLPVHSWVVSVDSGSVFVLIARQSILVSAVCVP